jgi:CheY-like chemotaxis protein
MTNKMTSLSPRQQKINVKSRILLVDDEAQPRSDIAALLRASGYAVHEAAMPEDAARIFAGHPFNFEVILTDLDFQNNSKDGAWLMREIFAMRANRGYDLAPEVVCLTGKIIDPNVANSVRQMGGQYVLKGLAMNYLLEVKAAIARIAEFRNAGPTISFVHAAAESGHPPEIRQATGLELPVRQAAGSNAIVRIL